MSDKDDSMVAATPGLPTVSIILPVLNEGRFIGRCLGTILRQQYPCDKLEVMILDGGSTDGTRQIVQNLAAQEPRIRLVDNPGRTQSRAFNLGFQQSKAQVIVRMDAHAEYDPVYVLRSVKTLQQTGAGNAGGVWCTVPGSPGLIGKAIAVAYSVRFGCGGARFRVGGEKGPVDSVPFGAFPRAVLEDVGPMREDLPRGEDNEFSARLRHKGHVVYFNPEIRATYFARPTVGTFLRQLYANGYYHMPTLLANPRGCSPRHFVPLAFLLVLLAFGLGGLLWAPAWWVGLAILSVYAVASLAASASASAANGWTLLAVLPWMFFLMHLSYGLGTLVGIVRFGLGRLFGRPKAHRLPA